MENRSTGSRCGSYGAISAYGDGLLLADSGLYAAATDQTNTHCANLVMARLTPTPADIVKQGVDGLDVLQEFGWLRYRTLLAGCM